MAGRDEAEHDLQLLRAQLGECRVNLEELSSELLRQQERNDHGEATTLCLFFNLDSFRKMQALFPKMSHIHPSPSRTPGSIPGTVGD